MGLEGHTQGQAYMELDEKRAIERLVGLGIRIDAYS